MPRRRVLVNTLSLTHGGGGSYVVNRLRVSNVRLPSPRGAARVVFRVSHEETLLPGQVARLHLLYCLTDLARAVRRVRYSEILDARCGVS